MIYEDKQLSKQAEGCIRNLLLFYCQLLSQSWPCYDIDASLSDLLCATYSYARSVRLSDPQNNAEQLPGRFRLVVRFG